MNDDEILFSSLIVRGSNTGTSSLATELLDLFFKDFNGVDEDKNLDMDETLFFSPDFLLDFSWLLLVFLSLGLSLKLSFWDQERTFILTDLCNNDDWCCDATSTDLYSTSTGLSLVSQSWAGLWLVERLYNWCLDTWRSHLSVISPHLCLVLRSETLFYNFELFNGGTQMCAINC